MDKCMFPIPCVKRMFCKMHVSKDWSTLFSFALGNERTLVTCKSCEARSASQRFTRDQCPFVSHCKRKKCTSILIFMLKWWKTPKCRNINVNFSVTWPVSFIGKYLPQISYASLQAKCHVRLSVNITYGKKHIQRSLLLHLSRFISKICGHFFFIRYQTSQNFQSLSNP